MTMLFGIPALADWVRSTNNAYYPLATPVAELGFQNLPKVWEPATLARARVAVVKDNERLPVPPTSLLPGIDTVAFAAMEGITYGDLYFVRERKKERESLHFHELVHVIQWNLLGLERFLEIYLVEMERAGYDNNRLEVMAYSLQHLFTGGHLAHKTEVYIRALLEGRPVPPSHPSTPTSGPLHA